MKRKEIAIYRQRLQNILKDKQESTRRNELEQLAKEVGAGYEHTQIAAVTTATRQGGTLQETMTYSNSISESELVLNINNALQTETMIDMCKTAAKNYRIAFAAIIIAFLSTLWPAIIAVNRYAISATENGGLYILDNRTGQTWWRERARIMDLGTTNKPKFGESKLVRPVDPNKHN